MNFQTLTTLNTEKDTTHYIYNMVKMVSTSTLTIKYVSTSTRMTEYVSTSTMIVKKVSYSALLTECVEILAGNLNTNAMVQRVEGSWRGGRRR